MRNTFIILIIVANSLLGFMFGMYYYGTFLREVRTYENMQPRDLHQVECIFDNENSKIYHIVMPSFKGITPEETHELKEAYTQGFCDSLR